MSCDLLAFQHAKEARSLSRSVAPNWLKSPSSFLSTRTLGSTHQSTTHPYLYTHSPNGSDHFILSLPILLFNNNPAGRVCIIHRVCCLSKTQTRLNPFEVGVNVCLWRQCGLGTNKRDPLASLTETQASRRSRRTNDRTLSRVLSTFSAFQKRHESRHFFDARFELNLV